MGQFKVYVQVWHDGKLFNAKSIENSDAAYAADHPEAFLGHVTADLQQQLRREYGDSARLGGD